MAQGVAVVNGTLSVALSGTTDFTSSGFGTPTAAIVIVSNANSTNNQQDHAVISIGFWDGTNQCCHSISMTDAASSQSTYRVSRNDYIAAASTSGTLATTWVFGYQASAVTDGIRLTLAVDNTSAQRYATVILLKGISAKIARLTLSSTLSGTATTGSLGFAPKAVLALTSGFAGNTPASGSLQTAAAIMSFGCATDSGTHRMIGWGSADAASPTKLTELYSETRCTGQVYNDTEAWTADVTTWGSDSLTMTSRTAGSGGDDVDLLVLGGADLSIVLGSLATATATGSTDYTTTGINPAAVLLNLSKLTSTTLGTDNTASAFSVGASDGTAHGSYASVDEDAASTSNSDSKYSSSNAVLVRTSASGTASDLIVGAVSMGTEKFSINYTTTDSTARKGWFLAFGPAASAGTPTLTDPGWLVSGNQITPRGTYTF